MNIEIPDFAGTEEKLIQVSEALEQIKNVLADLVYDMEEGNPAEDALESIDDAIDSINDAIDDLEEEELGLDERAEEEEESEIEGL